MSRNLWAKVTGGDAFRVNLPDGSYVSDLKDAIKIKLAVEFQHTDAPKIVIKNRVGEVVPGTVSIADYSPLADLAIDEYSLGVKPEFPYMIDVPTAVRPAQDKVLPADEQSRKIPRLGSQYFEIRASLSNSRATAGYRATIFKCAQDSLAYFPATDSNKAIWYEGESMDLSVRLWFKSERDAMEFQNKLLNFQLVHPTFFSALSVDENVYEIRADVSLQRVMYKHYKSSDNDESPVMSLNDLKLNSDKTTVLDFASDPSRALQSLENPNALIALKLYRCHLIPKTVKKYKDDPDNVIYGTWVFHQYFDGLNTEGEHEYPQLAVQFERAEERAEVDVGNGHFEWRQKIWVIIHFEDEDICTFMQSFLKPGSEKLDNLKWRSFLYVCNEETFKFFLQKKFDATKALWDAGEV